MLIMCLPPCSKEKDIAAMVLKADEDAALITSLQKKIRELEANIEELEEDLESERAIRKRVSAGLEMC